MTAELWPSLAVISLALTAGVRKRATLNNMSLPRAADLLGRMPCVCISTEDLSLARGEPADRRLFLDLELSSRYPAYLRHLSIYRRALEQRNALLKLAADRNVEEAQYETWESELAFHGNALRVARISFIEDLEPASKELHQVMGSQEILEVRYRLKEASHSDSELMAALATSRRDDIRRGTTSIGPHRDDFDLTIDSKEIRLFGSQGQQRTAVIALKMAVLRTAKLEQGMAPLLLLDDILSDLDAHRRAALVDLVLAESGQAVLTCTEASAAGEKILSMATVFEVLAGTVKRQ